MTTYSETLTGTYTVDPTHSRLGFVARHAMVTKVRGHFNEFEGTANIDATSPEKSTVNITINVASVDTGNDGRDEHLKTSDFFDMENYPEITFTSKTIEETENGFNVTGELTIKNTTKTITLPLEYGGEATDPWGNTRIGFEGSVQVNRTDWDLNWNTKLDAGGMLVSEKITLEFDISATKNQ